MSNAIYIPVNAREWHKILFGFSIAVAFVFVVGFAAILFP
jgi:hypothetical protein